MQAACSASRYKDFLHLRLSGGVEICISKSLRPLHSQVFQSLRQLHCWCTFVTLLHLANGAPVWTKLMQWGRLLPVHGNTGSHLLSCLSSKRSSFTSQSRRTSSAVVFAAMEGQSKKDGYLHRVKKTCHQHGPDLPQVPASPPFLGQTLRDTSDMCWLPKQTSTWKEHTSLKTKSWSPKKLPMKQIFWIYQTLWIQVVSNGEGDWVIPAQISKASMSGQNHCLQWPNPAL